MKVPAKVCVGLTIAIVLDTLVQVFWKMAVSSVPDDASVTSMVVHLLKQPLTWGVIVMFLSQLFNWIKVLGHADLSYAQPITSLSYISVCLLSAVLLREAVTPVQGLGIALILGGVWFISQTEHKTVAEAIKNGGESSE